LNHKIVDYLFVVKTSFLIAKMFNYVLLARFMQINMAID